MSLVRAGTPVEIHTVWAARRQGPLYAWLGGYVVEKTTSATVTVRNVKNGHVSNWPRVQVRVVCFTTRILQPHAPAQAYQYVCVNQPIAVAGLTHCTTEKKS